MKYYVVSSTEGCASNLSENVAYRKYFENSGATQSPHPAEADTIIVNTCAYNQKMEKNSVELIEKLQKTYPQKKIVVTGCFPKINPQLSHKIVKGNTLAPLDFNDLGQILKIPEQKNFDPLETPHFDLEDFSSLSHQHLFLLKLRSVFAIFEKITNRKFYPLHNIIKTAAVNENFHIIHIGRGCKGQCSYCAIKNVKGEIKSRSLYNIQEEFDKGYQQGKRQFWLIGDDVASWGADLGLHISDLLEHLLGGSKQDFTLVLNSFHPQFFSQKSEPLLRLLSDKKIIGINIPLQSASKHILTAMNRPYCPNKVLQLIRKLKTLSPNLAIKTNYIIAFPGESWGDFFSTIKSVFYFDVILAQAFAPRPNTLAENLPCLAPWVVKLRLFIIEFVILLRHSYVFISSLINLKNLLSKNDKT